MLLLDEQGLEVSSPWEMIPDRLLGDVVWPHLRDLWNRKEAWAGCSELDEDLQNWWDQAKQCLIRAKWDSDHPALEKHPG